MTRLKPAHPLAFIASLVLVACGGGGGDGGNAPAPAPTATEIQLLAGHIGGPGNIDGVGNAARFSAPSAAVRAPTGEIYVADTNNHLIRRIGSDGKVSIWAGAVSASTNGDGGHTDGERLAASFSYPSGIAIGQDGTVYVADSGNSVIRAISPAGMVRTVAGRVSQSGSADGMGATAQFAHLVSLLIEPSGSLLVVERDGGLRTVSPEGSVNTVATGLPAGLQLTGAGLDKTGRRLIAGRFGDTSGAALYRLDGSGKASLLTGNPQVSGTDDGDSASALFGTITSIAEDAEGNLLIADDYAYIFAGSRIMQTGGTTIRKLSANGMVSTIAGQSLSSGSADGDRISNQLCNPKFLSPYDGTNWLVTDSCNHAIRVLGSNGQLRTIAGLAPTTGNTNAVGDQARFSNPVGIATMPDGNAYVADFGNSSIRRISATGQSSLLTRVEDSSYGPTSMASNGTTEICFADSPRLRYSYTSTIRCTGSDGLLRELASSSTTGNAQQLGTITGITSDRQGNWLATQYSPPSNMLHSISSTGAITTLLKPARNLGAITSDQDGVVYLKIGNSIQKRGSDGNLTLVAGSPDNAGAQNGAGPEARFGNISAMAMGAQRYLYVADDSTGTSTIRLVNPSGQVSTLAGTPGLAGVRLGSAPGSLAPIQGLAVSADQKSLLATTANGVIRITLQR